MKIDEITVAIKFDNDDYKKAMNKLNEKIQEIKNIKDEMCIILSDLDGMLDGKILSAKTEVNYENRTKNRIKNRINDKGINILKNNW